MFSNEDDPLLAALAALREIDDDYVRQHGDDLATAEVEARLRKLRLTVAAMAVLHDRGEDFTPEDVRAEMGRLTDEFVFAPALLRELAVGFRADGDDVNADTAANAYEWMRLTYGAGN